MFRKDKGKDILALLDLTPKPLSIVCAASGFKSAERFIISVDLLRKMGYVIIKDDCIRLKEISSMEQYIMNTSIKKKEDIRYTITTIIAIVALIKSFINL